MDWGVNVFRKPGTPPKNNIPKNHGISKLVVWRSRPRLYTSKPLYSRVQWGMRKGKTTIWTCISYWFSTIMLVFWWVTFWGGLIFGRSKGNLLWEYLSMTWPSSTNMPLKVTDVVRAVSTSFHPLPPSKGGRKTIQCSLTMTCTSNRKESECACTETHAKTYGHWSRNFQNFHQLCHIDNLQDLLGCTTFCK